MIKNQIKAIIFDLGGVLALAKETNSNGKHIFNSFGETLRLTKLNKKDDESIKSRLLEIYFKSANGEISKKEMLKQFSIILNKSANEIEKSFMKIYNQYGSENKSLLEYALSLKGKKFKIGILSDQWHLLRDFLVKKKYFSLFDSSVISCEDCVKKPDKKAYFLILKKLKVKPKEAI